MSDPNGPDSLPSELVEEFLDDTDGRDLDQASWTIVDTLAQRACTTALGGTENAFRDAAADLELCSPTRRNDAGGGATGKQSAEQRGSKSDLKHTLKAPQQAGAGKSSGESRKGR